MRGAERRNRRGSAESHSNGACDGAPEVCRACTAANGVFVACELCRAVQLAQHEPDRRIVEVQRERDPLEEKPERIPAPHVRVLVKCDREELGPGPGERFCRQVDLRTKYSGYARNRNFLRDANLLFRYAESVRKGCEEFPLLWSHVACLYGSG